MRLQANMLAMVPLLMLAVITAHATPKKYYVRSDGDSTHTGQGNTPGSAWRRIYTANKTVQPGDTVFVVSLNPADSSDLNFNIIAPKVSGTLSARIVYAGSMSNPLSLPVPQIWLENGLSHITVRGFRAKAGASIDSKTGSAVGDTAQLNVIEFCHISSEFSLTGAVNCRVSDNTMRLHNQNIQGAVYIAGSDGETDHPRTHRTTLSRNAIDLCFTGGNSRRFWIKGFTDTCFFERNVVTSMCDPEHSLDPEETGYCVAIHESFGNTFRDNRWSIELVSDDALDDTTSRFVALAVRSGTHHNLWERDTLYFGINSDECANCDISLGQHSSLPAGTPQVYANSWKSCVFKTKNATTRIQHRLADAVMENCLFINRDKPGLAFEEANFPDSVSLDGSTIRHCTFFSGDAASLKIDRTTHVLNTNTVSSNLYLASNNIACSQGTVDWPHTGGGNMVSDKNVFYSTSGASSRALRVDYNAPAIDTCYTVGPSPGGTACAKLGDECNSVWGAVNPVLNGSWGSFEGTLSPDSPAKGVAFDDYYAGALRDAIAPSVITTGSIVEVGSNYITIGWNATGNDGAAGTAYEYDVRYSEDPISEGNFEECAQSGGAPNPASPGTPQTHTIEGLSPGTTYRTAIRVRDLQGNWSEVASLPCAQTIGGQGGTGCPERPGLRAQRSPTEGETVLPDRVALSQNEPNPFGVNTRMRFALPSPSVVRLEIFDIAGRRVRILREGPAPAGFHESTWDRRDDQGRVVQPGVYFCRLVADGTRERPSTVIIANR